MKKTTTLKKTNIFRKARIVFAGILSFAFIEGAAQTTYNFVTTALQTYTVPPGVTLIRIEARGAQGGSTSVTCGPTAGGLGARTTGDFTVTPGEVLSLMVGQQGFTNGSDGGGGGGTFVVRTGNIPLVVAGGGGGATNNIGSCGANRVGINAVLTTSGTASGNGLVAGGTPGNGGGASNGSGGAGGGFTTDGVGGTGTPASGGKSYVNGGAGGTGLNADAGGYGGGGAGWFTGGNGGGGGGYAGVGTNQNNTAAFQSGNGQVIITVLFSASIAQTVQILCNGQSTASLTATANGGTGPFTYSWAPSGGTAATATGLGAGTYTVAITDATMAFTSQTFTVTEPTALSQVIGFSDVTCNGACNGTMMTTLSGGTPSYTYSWSPGGATTASVINLCAGTYTCTATDANGCVSTQTSSITEPSALAVSSTQTNISCFGGSNGDATVAVTGGVGPYTYAWSSGGTAATEIGLVAGSYTCTITDANGCTATQVVTLTSPSAITTSVVATNISCFGMNDGAIDLTVTGGVGPYTFSWNGGTYTTEDLTGLSAGTYTGTLTDANGCTDGGTVAITEPAPLMSSVNASSDPTTCGGTDGMIDILVSGGTIGYTYAWDNSATSEDISSLAAGSYNCTVTDANGCVTMIGTTLVDPNPPTVTLTLGVTTICADDASITLSGGSPAGGVYSGPGVTGGIFDPSSSLVGANTITYTYTDSTTLCSASTTGVINVSACVGIATYSGESNFSLMPNPNNGTFILQLNTDLAADVMIYDAIGQLVNTMKVQPRVQQHLNIEVSGVYMITVVTADGHRSSQRVIVNK